jgi:hypothetical protein
MAKVENCLTLSPLYKLKHRNSDFWREQLLHRDDGGKRPPLDGHAADQVLLQTLARAVRV